MKKYKSIILIITIFSLFFVCNRYIYGYNFTFDIDGMARQLIEDGVGSNAIDSLITQGLLSEEEVTNTKDHNVKKFQAIYDKNTDLGFADEVITGYVKTYDRDGLYDDYNKKLFQIYKNIVIEMKETGKFDDVIAEANRDLNSSLVVRPYLESVAIRIFNIKVEEAMDNYKKNCARYASSNSKTFEMDGRTYKCSDVYHDYTQYGEEFGLDIFYNMYAHDTAVLGASKNNFLKARDDYPADKQYIDSFIDASYTTVTGKTPPKTNGSTNSNGGKTGTSTDGEENLLLYYDNVGSSYYPKLTNAFRFAKEFSDVGGLDSLLTGKDGQNLGMLEVVNQITTGIGHVGTYIMYGLIIVMGVIAIWSGVNGKVRFSETLPYVMIAIILFYAAPGVISIIKDIYTGASQSEAWFDEMIKNLFATLVNIIRTVAFMGIVISGIKLMFGGVKEKVKVKSSVVPLFIGSILVFAASIVVSFTLTTAKQAGVNTDADISSVTTNKT